MDLRAIEAKDRRKKEKKIFFNFKNNREKRIRQKEYIGESGKDLPFQSRARREVSDHSSQLASVG